MTTLPPPEWPTHDTERLRALLIEDDPQGAESTRKILEHAGYFVRVAVDGEAGLAAAREARWDVIVSDLRMPKLDGIELLRALPLVRSVKPTSSVGRGAVAGAPLDAPAVAPPVVLMTAFGRIEDAVEAMKLGAVDFLAKPFKRRDLLRAIDAALARSRAGSARSVQASQRTRVGPTSIPSFATQSVAMSEALATADRAAPTDATVLITGESGSGKEVLARRIHERSGRQTGPWVTLNCAAIPESLVEAELFGYERGAFSGATDSRFGVVQSAHGGTLFLDEIGDMPLATQAKLLRVLQSGEVRRVGSARTEHVSVRLLAATHQDLELAVREGRFRSDLFYRLQVIAIRVPALRERTEDIEALAAAFLQQFAERYGKPSLRLSHEATACLLAHAWPGNVRELANVIERAVVLSESEQIEAAELPPTLHRAGVRTTAGARSGIGQTISVPIGASLREVEDLLIRRTLEATEGDRTMTARLLGINSRTIYRKLRSEGNAVSADPSSSPSAPSSPVPEPSSPSIQSTSDWSLASGEPENTTNSPDLSR